MIDSHLVLVFEDEAAHLALTPRAMAAQLEAEAQFVHGLQSSGVLLDHGRLRPSDEGIRVRGAWSLDRPKLEAGPFPGPALARFYLLQAATPEDAATRAASCPVLPTDVVEVRRVRKGWMGPTRRVQRGPVFGFGVLGSAATEKGWDTTMDRIDAETSSAFPPERFLGGVRLWGPARRERHAHVDGPFAEAREVIDGLFFLRLQHVDDAARWAQASRFVPYGTLEVRELWRC